MLHNNPQRPRILAMLTAVVMLVALMAVLVGVQPAQAQGKNNPGILPPQSHPYGLTYGEWSAKWYQWQFAIPASRNPLNDGSGAWAATGQSGHVWFLAGLNCIMDPNTMVCSQPPKNTPVTRQVKIPSGTALLIPIANVEWDEYGYASFQDVSVLRGVAKGYIDQIETIYLKVDNKVDLTTKEDFASYRVTSPVFSYTMPATDNMYGLNCTSGSSDPICDVSFPNLKWANNTHTAVTAYPVVGDGYYIMLAPLSVGSHVIQFGFNNPGIFGLDIKYDITVVPAGQYNK